MPNVSNGTTFSGPDFKVAIFLKSNIGETPRIKDKVTIATMHNDRKLQLVYGIVLCLLTSEGVARVRQHQLSFLFK